MKTIYLINYLFVQRFVLKLKRWYLPLSSVSTSSILAFVGMLVIHVVSATIVMLICLIVGAFLTGLRPAENFFFGKFRGQASVIITITSFHHGLLLLHLALSLLRLVQVLLHVVLLLIEVAIAYLLLTVTLAVDNFTVVVLKVRSALLILVGI